MKLIANKSFSYAKRSLKAGDTFEASRQDARVLTAIGRASHHVDQEAAPIVTHAQAVVEPVKPAYKRPTYKRRDLIAEK